MPRRRRWFGSDLWRARPVGPGLGARFRSARMRPVAPAITEGARCEKEQLGGHRRSTSQGISAPIAGYGGGLRGHRGGGRGPWGAPTGGCRRRQRQRLLTITSQLLCFGANHDVNDILHICFQAIAVVLPFPVPTDRWSPAGARAGRATPLGRRCRSGSASGPGRAATGLHPAAPLRAF